MVKSKNTNGGLAPRNGNNNTPRLQVGRKRAGGGATGSTRLPIRRRAGPVSNGGQHQTISGYDFVTGVTIPKNITSTNAGIVDIGLSPRELSGTRWAQMATMFEKYRFLNLQMVYVPAVSSVIGAQLISYFELDPNDTFTLPSFDQMVRIGMAHQNAKLHNIYDTVTIPLPTATGITDFFVERNNFYTDFRFTQQARFRMLVTAGVTGFYDTAVDNFMVGSIFMRYTCLFKNPQIQPLLTVPLPTIKGIGDSPVPFLCTQSSYFSQPLRDIPVTTGTTLTGSMSFIGIDGRPKTEATSITLSSSYKHLILSEHYNLDTLHILHEFASSTQLQEHGSKDPAAFFRLGNGATPATDTTKQGLMVRKGYLTDSKKPQEEVFPVELRQWADGTVDLAASVISAGLAGAAGVATTALLSAVGLPTIVVAPLSATVSGIVAKLTGMAGIVLKSLFSPAQVAAFIEYQLLFDALAAEYNLKNEDVPRCRIEELPLLAICN